MMQSHGLFSPPRNFAGLLPPYDELERARVVVIPVPYDSTTEWKGGARHGPRAIIDASQYLELYDLDLGREPYRAGIHTLPEVQPLVSSPEDMAGRVREVVAGVAARDRLPLLLGGEHSLSLGAVLALRQKHADLTVLQLDAHTDLRDEYMGSRYSDACVARRMLEVCPVVQVGVRSSSLEEQEFLRRQGIRPWYMSAMAEDQAWAQKAATMLSGTVYVTIDMDVFDPAVMPAVGTPEPDGMDWRGVVGLLKLLSQRARIVGCDVMELSPQEGPSACAFLAARLAYRLIGCAVPEPDGKS